MSAGRPGHVNIAKCLGSRSSSGRCGQKRAQGLGQLRRRGRAVGGNSERRRVGEKVGVVQIDVDVAAVEDLLLDVLDRTVRLSRYVSER